MKGLLFFALYALSFSVHADPSLSVSEAWIPEAPPVAKVMAGYLEIKNKSDRTIILESISANDFERVEMHQTIKKNGMAKMVKQTSIKIPAHGGVSFRRGGLHLMLIGPKRKFKRGEKTRIILKTDQTSTEIDLVIKEASLDDHSAHH